MKTLHSAKQILIVDDDAPLRDGLARALEAAGHQVRTAANGLEALGEARALRPDLILLDLVMPVMDGWCFRTEQMEDPDLADIPVVVLSAGGEATKREAALMGMPTYFRKPRAGTGVQELMGDLLDGVNWDGIRVGPPHGAAFAFSNSHPTA
jgi:CheY-like chemotaxis protein